MDGFIPTGGAGSTALVQSAEGEAGVVAGTVAATFVDTPTVGNTLVAFLGYRGVTTAHSDPAGWTKHADLASTPFDGGRLILYSKVAGVAESPTLTITSSSHYKVLRVEEWSGLTGFDAVAEAEGGDWASTYVSPSLTPGVSPAVLFAGFVQASRAAALNINAPFAETWEHDFLNSGPSVVVGHRIVSPASGAYTATATSNLVKGWAGLTAAFEAAGGGITWVAAPDTVDGSTATSDDVDATAIANADDAFWRGDIGTAQENVGQLLATLGMEDAGAVTILVQGGDEADWSDAATVVQIDYTATGSYTADDVGITWDASEHRYWRLALDTAAQGVRVYEVELLEGEVFEEPEAARAILEIYVHDEDASRWGEATWATGPATGTEGIWSAAGWQDVTPEGVNVHVIWGSRRPERGILAEQDAASWLVQTYDPDRNLDPGNMDSPYWPQLVAGVPIRVSHESTVIRTGYIDELSYKHKAPNYRGTILATDTVALLHKATVPADSVLGDTLLERIQDAINAAGIAVGGIPLPPGGPSGPPLADWVEGAATDAGTSVWEIIRKAGQEVLYVPYVQADAGLGLRAWGAPLDRGREITAENLEDLESVINEDGVYSVARVQVSDPDLDPIEREASPLPRYGRRVIDRREPTVDAEGWADAVLQERSWPGVQYIPGTIHCFTAADVEYFGSLEIMERVTITVAGAVSVQGRILGGELWVEHRKGSTRGATWMFKFAVATDGSTAIGLTTLVADGTGETLLDDATETDYLEAD